METKIEELLEKLSEYIEKYTSNLEFEKDIEFELDQNTNLENELRDFNGAGIYFLEIKKNNKNFDDWLKDFKIKWITDEIAKTPKIIDKRIVKLLESQEKMDSLELIPFYIGKSENIKKRVLEHLGKPANSTTSALKLQERKSLYGMKFRLNVIKIETKYYDLVMHKIEQELREIHNPIVGKH